MNISIWKKSKVWNIDEILVSIMTAFFLSEYNQSPAYGYIHLAVLTACRKGNYLIGILMTLLKTWNHISVIYVVVIIVNGRQNITMQIDEARASWHNIPKI